MALRASPAALASLSMMSIVDTKDASLTQRPSLSHEREIMDLVRRCPRLVASLLLYGPREELSEAACRGAASR